MNKHSLCMLCICDHATSVSIISHFLTLLIDSLKHFRLKGQCCVSLLPISMDNLVHIQSTKVNLEPVVRETTFHWCQ